MQIKVFCHQEGEKAEGGDKKVQKNGGGKSGGEEHVAIRWSE